MARKYLVSIDLGKNEIQNAVVQVLASAPSSPVEGQVYYNSVDKVAYIYNGTAWKKMEENVAISFGTPGSSAVGDSAAAGSASTIARSDHTHGREAFETTPSTQAVGDTASAGSATTVPRGDHKHAMPSFGNVSAQTSSGASSGNGSSSSIARADHTHGTPAHTGTEHSSVSISSLAAPTGNLAMGTYKITGLGDPTSDQDAATKIYVDSAVQGLAWKDSVRVATTTSGTLASSFENGDSIDGITLATGDRILLKDQSTGSQNGIYTVNASGAPTRATDANTAAKLKGAAVFVEEGSQAGNQYVLTTDGFTLDTDALSFVQFGGGTTYTAGAGLTLSGSTFNVGAGTGITVNADDVAIDTSTVARKYIGTITGDGATVNFDFTHSLQQWVSVQVIDGASPYDQVECDVERTSSTACRVKFATAPANAKVYKVIIVG